MPTEKHTPRVYAQLGIYPEVLDPYQITLRLGIDPSLVRRLGEPYTLRLPPNAPDGEERYLDERKRPLSVWVFSSEKLVLSEDPTKHLSYIVRTFEKRKDLLAEYLSQPELFRVDIKIHSFMPEGYEYARFPSDLMAEAAALCHNISIILMTYEEEEDMTTAYI